MLHISSIMNWLAIGRHVDEPGYPDSKHRDATESENTIELDSNDAVAVMAYGEAIENMAINHEVVDSLLIDEMTNAIDSYPDSKDLSDSQSISKELLPTAKEVIHNFYTQSKKSSVDHKDICHSVHEECDVELLKSLTHIYAKSFIKQYYK